MIIVAVRRRDRRRGARSAFRKRSPVRSCSFRSAAPIRCASAREGTVADVRAAEGQSVTKGATMFVIRSQSVGDRSADMRTLEMQMSGRRSAHGERAVGAREPAARRRAGGEAARRRGSARSIALSTLEAEAARDDARPRRRGSSAASSKGIVGGLDAERLVLDAGQLEAEVEAAVVGSGGDARGAREAAAGYDDARRAVSRA